MCPNIDDDLLAHMRQLLRENAETIPPILESTQRAIDESRRLLARVAEDHPEID